VLPIIEEYHGDLYHYSMGCGAGDDSAVLHWVGGVSGYELLVGVLLVLD